MESKVNYAIVGAFVLVLGAALIAGVLWLAVGGNSKKKYAPYQVIVKESVAGLSIDAPVKYLGVNVGKVAAISIDPENTQQVMLKFLIERGTPIKEDTEAVLKSQGLTGIAYVEINGGSAASPFLVPSDDVPVPTIRSKPSLSARLENVATTVLANLDNMTTNLNAMLDADNRIALKTTLADTAALMQVLSGQREALKASITNAAQIATNTARASEKFSPAMDRVTAGADAIEKMAIVVGRAGESAALTADAAQTSVRQLNTETLPELARLLVELNQLAPSLRRLIEQTERTPTSLLLGGSQVPMGPGEKQRTQSTQRTKP
jgi:phospholipid/cholesterol/gamma-HCH transport system substrate-binding protein